MTLPPLVFPDLMLTTTTQERRPGLLQTSGQSRGHLPKVLRRRLGQTVGHGNLPVELVPTL